MQAFAGARPTSDPPAAPRVRAARVARPRLRLVEVGLRWPPETFIAQKLRSLAECGFEVEVGSFPDAIDPGPGPSGVEVQELPDLRGGAYALKRLGHGLLRGDVQVSRALLGGAPGLPLRLWRLYSHLLGREADLLHFEWLTVAAACLPLLRRWKGPIVVSCRGFELSSREPFNRHARRSMFPEVFARADAVHVVSQAKRDEALTLGLDPAKATLIRPAVDTEFFRPAGGDRRRERRLSLVSVSSLRWVKGFEYALLAIAELAGAGMPVTLDIVGGDPTKEMGEPSQRVRILHTIRDLGLQGRVRLLGGLPPDVVRVHLQRADALLHTSLSEGLPNVVLEAMACGLPVVATNTGGTPEAVRHGVDGLLVAARDHGATAAALRGLAQDPGLRARMGCAGRSRTEEHFGLDRQNERWVELYQRVAGHHREKKRIA